MQLTLIVKNVARKLVTVVSDVLAGREICRRFAKQPGFTGNTVSANEHIDAGKLQSVTPSRQTALKIYSLRFYSVIAVLLLVLGTASRAQAATVLCSEFSERGVKGVVDGNDPATLAKLKSASTFGIDMNCTIKNFPQSMGGFPITNINFNFPQQQSYYIAFLDVYYYGNMSCNDPTQSDFWIYWAPGGFNSISPKCQDFMVPADAVSKKNPQGQTTAVIGVPFTYTITMPLLGKLDEFSNFHILANAEDADITNVVITDDLTQTGYDLTYLSATAYEVNPSTGARNKLGTLTPGVSQAWLDKHPGILSDDTKHLVFYYDTPGNEFLRLIPHGWNIEIDFEVVLDNSQTNLNAAGKQFINTAKMWFDKPINSTAMADLEAWPGTSPPMTIIGPDLTLTKTASVHIANLNTQVQYTLDLHNIKGDFGGTDAWNVEITDNFPVGMSAFSPLPTVTAKIIAADGNKVKDLAIGTDFTLNPWNGSTVSAGQLIFTLGNNTPISPDQHLIVNYQSQLDSTGVADGTTLTNIAGVTKWFSANSSITGRGEYDRVITKGTPGILDFQDAWDVTAVLAGYYFLKTVQDLTTGANDATAAYPGDRLRYTLQILNYTKPTLTISSINDDLGALNPAAVFVPGSLSINWNGTTVPPANVRFNPNGGTNGAGSITINTLTLDTNQKYQIQFDVTLATSLSNGTKVSNQADLTGIDSNGQQWAGPSDDPNVNGQVLLGSGGDPTVLTIQRPEALSKINPTPENATIGQEFSYLITVPAKPTNIPLYDVTIQDNLGLSAANMTFVNAQVVSGGTWNLTNTGTATDIVLQDLYSGIDIPAGSQAVIKVTVALQNTTANLDGVKFTNTASYTYNKLNGGNSSTEVTGGQATTSSMTVVEPHLTAAKTVSYASPAGKSTTSAAVPGDVLQYTVTIHNNGSSEAYDANVIDFLPSNVSLVNGSVSAQINGVSVSGFITTPTVLASGAVVWGAQNGDPSLDIPVGGTLVLTYQVNVLATSGVPITNNVYAAWTSLDGLIRGERTGAGCPNATPPDNYCSGPASSSVTSFDPTTLAKSVVSDSWTTTPSTGTDKTLRVGDTVVYSLALTLGEGVTQNALLTDNLPAGMAYDGLVSITPSSGSNFHYTVNSQPTPGATGTLTWNLGNITNDVDNNAANNTLIIQYRARVINTLAQMPTIQQLPNGAALSYAINGNAATTPPASATINAWQSVLNVSKTAAPAGGGTVITAGELITYTVDIKNNGSAPAYNPVLTDTLPVGLRQGVVITTSIMLVNAGTVLPVLNAPYFSYNSTTGVATWNFDDGVANHYTIPVGESLRVVYQVRADAGLGAGLQLDNQALVQHYYSLDSQDPNASYRKDYPATSPSIAQLSSFSPTALSKQAQVTSAAVGQPFTYQIRIPASPQPTAMYDVHVTDDLSLARTGVTMSYVSADAHLESGTKSWPTLNNSGTASNFNLSDTTNGLDIPANDQLLVNVTVVLNSDTVNNTVGKQFQNTANYTFDSIDNNTASVRPGSPGTSGAITIIGPNLTMVKSGPSTMNALAPGTFTLNVQNNGSSTAWGTTITDILPNVTGPSPGSMCASAPTNVTAEITNGTLSTQLVNGIDFTVRFVGAPACTFTIAMKSSVAAIKPTERLIVKYDASLDPYTAGGITLTNIAGATQWLSADPAVTAPENIQTYPGQLTNGTPGVPDNQDAFTLTTQAPSLTFNKTVQNVTTGQSGANAKPGDTLQYTLEIQNIGSLEAKNFTLTDDLDKLNASAMFAPGTLKLITVPAGANTTSTSATGGTKGTGLVSISNLSVAPQGQTGDKLVIQFQVTLAAVINNGSLVMNQAQIGSPLLPTQLSDDPSLAGTANPTQTLISSAPAFQVLKTVRDITSGTATVTAGDTLSYTITVKNIGTENATGVTLRDLIPANTTYVGNSTTLNGSGVSDPGTGVSALQNGILINSPANPTAGAMPANAGTAPANVATITFQVQISKNVVDGTLISNQGFVNGSGAASGPFPERPSDNPATPVLNDPTTVVVGNLPLVYALKTVQLVGDVNGNGSVESGDTLQYIITMTNSGATQASGVVLTDAIPANTTYVANSVLMNGVAVADPSPGVSPLTNGMGVISSGLTPPSPSSSGGTLAAGGTGTVTFKVIVNNSLPAGTTYISNQGSVATAQLPTLQTDSDGNPTNGYQPTIIAIGDAQQLSMSKSVAVVGGGAALPGSVLEYTIKATNVGTVQATNVVITDDLTPLFSQANYVDNSAAMNGSSNGVIVASSVITANYGATKGTLVPGGSVVVRFRVKLNGSVAIGSAVTNTAQASWNTPAQTTNASTSISVGGTPGSGTLSGFVWRDVNLNNTLDSGEQTLADWVVELYKDGGLVGTVNTGADGSYNLSGITPNNGNTIRYELRFRAQDAGANTAKLGRCSSPFTNDLQRISDIVVSAGGVLPDMNLPLTPNGVVYNAILRTPIAGATLNMVQASSKTPLPTRCFNDPVQQGQVTQVRNDKDGNPVGGFYKFDLNFSDPSSCPAGGAYLIQVTPPASGYMAGVSKLVPPISSSDTAPFSVPTCPGSSADAVPTTSNFCEAQASDLAPAVGVLAGTGTAYYLNFTLDNVQQGYSQIYNNHIAIDPTLDTAVAITKTTELVNVTRGQLVPYTITLKNTLAVALQNLSVVDSFPLGFKYVAGSTRIDAQKIEPVMNTRQLIWSISQLTSNTSHTITFLMIVGSGVSEGEYVNRAQVMDNATGSAASGIASATVRVVPDPDFDCTDIIGKVFDDANGNSHPDSGEKGLPGVRLVTARGLIATTDEYGRFHITCAVVPNEDQGSNFILKLDDRTLPTGYRLTSENPQVKRATRGKMLRYNFGAAIQHVVSLDIADGVFEPNSTKLRLQWQPRTDLLLKELRKAPSVLRLSYLADVENKGLVEDRLKAMKKEITGKWDGRYRLTIETEVFWRRGSPP
jgi:uncharacterized repeat protein (TIGR01451 family)/fimbrial isopeptide formation D2 family protein